MNRLLKFALAFIVLFQFSPAQASSGLGLSIDVIPSSDAAVQKVSNGQSLWFVIPPGSQQSRSFRISSTSSTPEIATFSVGFLGRVDGEAIFDDAKRADSAEWAKFEPAQVRLSPHGSATITFTYRIPAGTDIGIHEAYLFATAHPISSQSNLEYQVPQNARIAVPIFLGVGTSDQISTDFEIIGVKGSTVDGAHKVRMVFENSGKTPIRLGGTIQLASTVFKADLIGPLTFNSLTIRPGERGFVDTPVPASMAEGEYEAFVQASQGAITKTKRLTVDISFNEPSKWIYYLLRIAIASLFIVIIFFSWRFLKKSQGPKGQKTEAITELSESSSAQVEKMLAEITARALKLESSLESVPEFRETPLQKKANIKKTAKKVAEKAPAKKKVAKKAPVKKAVAKKAVTKKT